MDVMASEIVQVSSEYIDSWDEYFLALAVTVARKSKDPKCRVGAVIVQDRLVVSTGFNGLARNVFDDPSVLDKADKKLKVICHAEQNAIWNAARYGLKLKDATIFVTKFPCLRCCNAIIQTGIQRIYTHDGKYWDDDPDDGKHEFKQSMLRQAGLSVDAPFHPDYKARRVLDDAKKLVAASPIQIIGSMGNIPANDDDAVPLKSNKQRRMGPKKRKSQPGLPFSEEHPSYAKHK